METEHTAGAGPPADPGQLRASIVLASFDGRDHLEGCLASVVEQLEPGDEVIAVDNASSDGTADWIEARFPAVRVVRNAENRGFAAACNQGAALARGEALVFLNQDTRVAPGGLRALVGGLRQEDDTGLTTSQVRLMSQPERIQLCGQEVHYTGLVFARGFGQAAEGFPVSEEVAAVSGAAFAIRRDLWEALGGLDEAFFMYYEETDLCWRARLAGYRSRFLPGSVVYHDYRPGGTNPARFYHSARNRYQMLLKNWRAGTLLLLAPGLLLAELVEWGLALRMGGPGLNAKARANGWVLAHLGEILKRRAPVQASRRVPDTTMLRERSWRLAPVEVAPGRAGRAVVKLINVLLWIDGLLAFRVCRWLAW